MEYADFENFEILKCFIYGWMDGMGWMDGVSKVSFIFFHTLWVYKTCTVVPRENPQGVGFFF